MTVSIGQPLPRKEDLRLLTGGGTYSDDFALPGQACAIMLRSPHAHARIGAIDTQAARALPGVLAVLTGADAVADGLKPIPHHPTPLGPPADIALKNRDGSPHGMAPHPILPTDRARFVGDAVVMVVAETLAAAQDAAERVIIDYEPLQAVTATAAAAQSGAPRLYDQVANVCIDADVGDAAATAAAFAQAAHVVSLQTWVQRVTGVPLDARAAIGAYDKESGRYTLYAGSGGVVRQKNELAGVLGVAPAAVRVVSGDVGGNFGTRNAFYPEFALVAWAAKRVGRPVKWTCERSEAFLCDYQGRDQVIEAELALDADGRFLAMRGAVTMNAGAYSVMYVPLVKCVELLTSVYRVPAAHFRARAVLSNTPPTNPYRSAGRPEAMFVIERLIDRAAQVLGRDRVALRRRNLVPASAMPHANGLGMTYDSGDYRKTMERALALADWHGFNQRRREAKRRGKLRGIGLANYIEATSGAPREFARITVQPEGRIDVVVGTLSSGQGHETSFAQCVAEWLGVSVDAIRLIQGDTDVVPVGGGSHSGRSMRMAGIVMGTASDEIIAKATRIAAHALEADAADIAFADGRFTVTGTDRSIGLFEVAAAARTSSDLPDDLRGPLRGRKRPDHPRRRLPVRLPCLRGRDRSRNRDHRDCALRGDRRCRPRGQSADPAWPDPWRRGAGRRPGALGAQLLRSRHRAGAGRIAHGLCAAARQHAARVRDRAQRDAGAVQSARYPRRRRRRHHPGARRCGQCCGRRAQGLRRDAPRNAGDAGARVARHARGR